MENKRKGIIGGVSAILLATGGFVWQNGGKQVAGDITRTAITQSSPEIKAMIPDSIKATFNLNPASAPANASDAISPSEMTAFEQAYLSCHDATLRHPNINPQDAAAVYDADVLCLLVHYNQGATLDKMALQDAELKQTLIEIRQKFTQMPPTGNEP